MTSNLNTVIVKYIADLKEKEKKNGGFPNTDLMINAFEEYVEFILDTTNTEIFDELSETYRIKFETQLKDLLDLDPETRQWMDDAIERAQQH
jgi:hypothetical protein